VVLIAGWAETRVASGLAAGFIMCNSIAGIAGNVARLGAVPASLPLWLLAVLLGALIGSEIGSRRGRTVQLRTILSVVLVIAGAKLIVFG
jgi:uncharacterized membrane protein YfcA